VVFTHPISNMDLSNKREELGRNGVTVLKETCVASLNPKICLGTSAKRGGRGLYAKDFIGKGEWIWRDAPGYAAAPKSWEQLSELPESALKNFLHFCYCTCRGALRFAAWALARFHPVYAGLSPAVGCGRRSLRENPELSVCFARYRRWYVSAWDETARFSAPAHLPPN
jgi:hypothetical protein